ncbi:MAG: fucose isomerase, partial [Eubacterium sp.]|nr:fucose isomerase [Eubacterium sp.]
MQFNYLYIPIGVPTFHLESAGAEFEKSIELLKGIDDALIAPDEMLLSIDKLNAFTADKNPDFVIVQNITFANGAYIAEVLRRFECPVLLWTLREPVIDGGRLRLNSLTGAFSAANVLKSFDRPFEYIFGAPTEDEVKRKISSSIRAARVKKALKSLNVLQVGHTPQGFGFGRALDMEMMTTFGATLNSIEARELIDKAKTFTDDEIKDYLDDAKGRIKALDEIKEKNVLDFARLYRAYDEYVKDNDVGALSSRCWPDFFTAFGTPVCAVLAMLNDLGVAAACEADTYGALTMYISQFLTDKPAFFGDPVSMDEGENTVTFWHCGTAACSLAREDTGACAGVHCNRKIGPTLEFGCKVEKDVTIFRIGKKADGTFRFFIAEGEALDKPQQFFGTSIVVKTDGNAKELVYGAVKSGWEPHFAVAMGGIAGELEALANMLG